MRAYLGVDVTALSQEPLILGMYLLAYGWLCWWWHSVGIDLFHPDTDRLTRVGKSMAFPVMTLALAINPGTVALFLAAPPLAWLPPAIAAVRMVFVAGSAGWHLLRVAYLQPAVVQTRAIRAAQHPGVMGPAVRVLEARQQQSLEQAAAWWQFEHNPGGPLERPALRAQPEADQVARAIEQRRGPA